MTHHIIKSLLFSASLSKVHRTIFTLALGAMLLTATVGCEKENDPIQPSDNDGKVSLVHTAWQGRMVNTTFDDTYWEEELVFMSDSTALLFRKAIFEGELTGARTIETTYTFDGVSSGTIFGDENTPFSYETINDTLTLTIEDYYPHVFHPMDI